MTDNEIKAADWAISIATIHGRSTEGLNRAPGVDREVLKELKRIAAYVERDGLIEVNKVGGYDNYKLTPDGDEFKRSGKKYADFLAMKEQKELRQIEKEKRDDQHKDLQIEKLLIELKVIKDMQNEQRVFWQSGIERDKRQKWQFWITWFLSGAAFLMSIFNLIKDLYIK